MPNRTPAEASVTCLQRLTSIWGVDHRINKGEKNTFIKAGSVITKSTKPNTIVCGNPQQEEAYLNDELIEKINRSNEKYFD